MMQIEKNRINISVIIIFWITFVFFILTAYLSIFSMYLTSFGFYSYLPFFSFFIGWKFLFVILIQAILGIILIVLASKGKFIKNLKAFLILTGASAVFIFLSIVSLAWIVHNLYTVLFGENPDTGWVANGTVILFQLAFLVGAIGSIVLLTRKDVIVKE
jgi:hypothetical protein